MSEQDRTDELTAVLEALADWLDEYGEHFNEDDQHPELVAAVAQIIELTQLLLAEHGEAVQQINHIIGVMALAKQEAYDKTTGLIVANAGDARKYIKGV